MRRTERGFTVVELLVVITLCGLLLALLLPAVQLAREAARAATCKNHLRQIGLALANAEAAQKHFPAGNDYDYFRDLRYSWCTRILPFLDQAPLAAQYNDLLPWDSTAGPPGATNRELTATNLKIFLCPSEPLLSRGRTDYAGNTGSSLTGLDPGYNQGEAWVAGALIPIRVPSFNPVVEPVRLGQIVDGLSQTLLVYECSGRESSSGMWGNGQNCLGIEEPLNARRDAESIVSRHPHGGHALFCDGRVQFLHSGVELPTLGALATRNSGEATAAY